MDNTILYGIAQCSTVQKARDWLDSNHVGYTFVDFKKTALSTEQVTHWLNLLGTQKLINKQSLTWRKLSEADKKCLDQSEQIITLLIRKPTLIKRPLLMYHGKVLCGFSVAEYQDCLR
ncbi:MAG: Spx/MgsR family RNA polymerase-binding regulatory protein [Neisseriales bacterium]|nr:MAG: Spx/MgsR family RNA polymerase-binding regulatory protein [Neisseriales bacterium]